MEFSILSEKNCGKCKSNSTEVRWTGNRKALKFQISSILNENYCDFPLLQLSVQNKCISSLEEYNIEQNLYNLVYGTPSVELQFNREA